jgi:hypothetical protein
MIRVSSTLPEEALMPIDPTELVAAQTLAQSGRIDEALAAFQVLHEAEPSNLDIFFMVGACYFKKENYDEARTIWEHILLAQPNHSKATAWLAQIPTVDAFGSITTPQPAPKAPAQKAAGKKVQDSEGGSMDWLKKGLAAVSVVVVLVAAYAIYSSTSSGPPPRPADLQVGATAPVVEQSEPLAPNLPGRWSFKWEQNPATVTFFADGKVTVNIQQGGNLSLTFNGTWKLDGNKIVLENLMGADPSLQIGGAELYDAKIIRSRLTFRLNKPDGSEVAAIKQ